VRVSFCLMRVGVLLFDHCLLPPNGDGTIIKSNLLSTVEHIRMAANRVNAIDTCQSSPLGNCLDAGKNTMIVGIDRLGILQQRHRFEVEAKNVIGAAYATLLVAATNATREAPL
jgi:hypothetical protein